jgi:hypothetical protein
VSPSRTATATAAADLHGLAGAVRPVAMAGDRVLPVSPSLHSLLPDRGLRRGSVVAVNGRAGATSLVLALIAGASAEGLWCAAVGVGRPSVGVAAAAEAGVHLERFAVVSAASGTGPGGWAWTVAVLLEAIDIVVTWPPAHVRPADARRLTARGRERGAVLVVAGAGAGVGADGHARRAGWPAPVDVQLGVSKVEWRGIGPGHGHLEARSMEVVAGGRGAAARERRAELSLSAAGGPLIGCNQSVVKMAELASITTL